MRSVVQVDTQAGRPPAPAGRRSRGPAWAGRVRRRYRWISLVAGALIVVMTYFPIVFVVSNSLKTGRNIFSSGVFSLFTQFDYQNYSTAWSGVSRPLVNTIIVAAASIALGVTAAALGAYAFSQLRFRGLPAAGRAAWLARRRPGLRPHRLLQPRRRRVLRQMAG